MRNFQDTFETRKPSFISAFSICMTVTLNRNSALTKLPTLNGNTTNVCTTSLLEKK